MTSKRFVSLAHGNGGRYMRQMIADIFAHHLNDQDADPSLDVTVDAARMDLAAEGVPFITTDGFIVQPLEFPGGDIGSLAIHGTVNDLAVSGARPIYLTLNAFIEEGLEMDVLDRIVSNLSAAARVAGVKVLAGDTKVVPRGNGGGLYLATTGVGLRPERLELGMHRILPGDRIVVSGPVGDHGVAVMLARQEFEISGDVRSDSASVLGLTKAAQEVSGLRFMRDPTRAGLAGVAVELSSLTGLTVSLDERAIPVRPPVSMVCEMLGYDPYYLACEGRVVAVVAEDDASDLLSAWRALPEGSDAAIIGHFEEGEPEVVLKTSLSGRRVLQDLEEDPLPRIC